MKAKDITAWEDETEKRVERAVALFREGYNCSQSVSVALCDLYDVPPALMARMAASFGAGIGRMRETCGTACGMFILAGFEVTGPEDAVRNTDGQEGFNPYPSAAVKKANYQVVQRLAQDFRAECGSLLCRDLLGLSKPKADGSAPEIKITATPEARTEDYYQRRPCPKMVETAVRIYMNYLKEKYQ